MTAPVIQEPVKANVHLVSFVLPNGTDPSSVPVPANSSVVMKAMPDTLTAVRSFSGSWNEQRFENEGNLLLAALVREELEPVGNLYWARFDPPWKPGFLKRNEVLINLKKAK